MTGTSGIPSDQAIYFRERASAYDDWWQQRRQYDRGPEHAARFAAEAADVAQALARFDAAGSVLEIAPGTGWWTQKLARTASRLTCLDSWAEAIALNRQRLEASGFPAVRHVQADVFGWEPIEQYDVVFFSFWLSHVPTARFADFWSCVRRALKPTGRAFFIDEAPHDGLGDSFALVGRSHRRVLEDGGRFTTVKIYYSPAAITQRLTALDWEVSACRTPTHFVYGAAQPR